MRYKGIYEGNSLRHYRTKGSKNGISKNPDYKPIGKLAKGPKYYDSRRDDPDWEENDDGGWNLSKSANDRLWKESFAETGEMYKNVGKKVGEGLLNVFTKGAYGRSKKLGKFIANKVASESKPTAVPVYKPNKKSPEQEYNMRSAERRRIEGGNTGTRSVSNGVNALKNGITGAQGAGYEAKIKKRKELKNLATEAGKGSLYTAANGEQASFLNKWDRDYRVKKLNEHNAELRRIKGGSQGTSFDSSKKAQYDAEQRRIKGGSQGTSFDRQKAAENRRIAGGRTAGTGTRVDRTKDTAKDIVKKGKKKVKSLMKRFFN